ncbi:MAG: Type IV pilus biogenesis ATPase PilM [Candidatus Gottesmanbacteria bacterium GW2011_GWC2_39_8]|uniref:Type IV pilus biogenesis ATPase PilM n=1 Tax=Candidatus Gottesmanbacteria bacterium GW2011_GWC2_39_8 TaxID=1618450 RepID=A0A0G0PVN2_9BACT|nr:MAG: Type IV pilus biogenesis ATPase PilM [Candidatus Gottesmanbacteria bacterium GW2011_GWC2_39_8]
MSAHSQTVIGLDFGSHFIKGVELRENQGHFSLLSLGQIATPPKGLFSDLPIDEQVMIDTVIRLIKEMKVSTKLVNTALPESQVFTRVIEVPRVSDKELSSALQWEAEQYIPLPLEEVNLDYAVINENMTDREKMEILLVAAPLKLIEKYTRILESAGLNPASLETEIIAAARALSPVMAKDAPTLLMNIGSSMTDIAVVNNSLINFTRTLSIGGEMIIKSISQELGFSMVQSEEYIKAYGIEKDKLEGKIFAAAKTVVDSLIEEVKKTISYYKEKHNDKEIKSLVLSGGVAKMPGLVFYIASEVGLETQIGNPIMSISKDEKIFGKLGAEVVSYSVACGLALKEI